MALYECVEMAKGQENTFEAVPGNPTHCPHCNEELEWEETESGPKIKYDSHQEVGMGID